MTQNIVDITLILPAYNEEKRIQKTIINVDELLEKTGFSYEIIVVDDGSTDKTSEKAQSLMQCKKLTVFGYPHNRGKGFALKTGFYQSSGKIIIFLDSDMDIKPSLIFSYIKALKNADIAIASKWHPESKVEIPIDRKILSLAFRWLYVCLLDLKLNDTQTGFKTMKREVLETIIPRLNISRFAFDVEFLYLVKTLKYRIIELPVDIKISSLDHFPLFEILRMFRDLLTIFFNFRILKRYEKTA